jgi:acetylornithine/N-succinyldiaminopimelate aminotransferase
MGACLAKGKAAPVFKAGDHQSTFGGNPLACSGGLVVLEETGKPGFLARVSEKGDYIRSKIAAWKLPCVTEIRGKGLMIGIDVTGTCSKSATAGEIQLECLKDGLCISTAGPQTLRFLPPLVITMEEIDAGLEILKKILA